MAVVMETTIGDLTIDLFLEERPKTCLNFLKLCKIKFYNLNLIFSIEENFIAQMGDPTSTGRGGESIYKSIYGEQAQFYEGEKLPIIRHTDIGMVSMVSCGDGTYGSQFFITLGENLDSLDDSHLVFGKITEGMNVVDSLNATLTDEKNRPYKDIYITHMVVLNDPYPDPTELVVPDVSPEPSEEIMESRYIAAHEDLDDDVSDREITEEIAAKEAEARATILEMVGDLPDADMAPPENVLFVCKLNPVTTSEDLQIIFSRFGDVYCEVITDKISGRSLQYAFVEFPDQKSCENAYFKMDNVLIDERRIHVDFSQSVSKIKWRGKGRGVDHFDDKGQKINFDNVGNSKREKDKNIKLGNSPNYDRMSREERHKDRKRENCMENDKRRDYNVNKRISHKSKQEFDERRDYNDGGRNNFERHRIHGSDNGKRERSRNEDNYINSRDRYRENVNGKNDNQRGKTNDYDRREMHKDERMHKSYSKRILEDKLEKKKYIHEKSDRDKHKLKKSTYKRRESSNSSSSSSSSSDSDSSRDRARAKKEKKLMKKLKKELKKSKKLKKNKSKKKKSRS